MPADDAVTIDEPASPRVLSAEFSSEPELASAASAMAAAWRQRGLAPLRVALRGELGTGKTTWARAMLRGLGHAGRVPSPTYTLVEHYALGDLTVAHFDLYRLRGAEELENLGFRDWLAEEKVWLLIEWPERGGDLPSRCDLELEFVVAGPEARVVRAKANSAAGGAALEAFPERNSNNGL
jgi:tRNA threonylcarbamoyladenosine biosynthesis protein TsaE